MTTPDKIAHQEQLFRNWVDRHQGLLFKVIRSHEADPDNQQDLLQQILVQLWQSASSYTGQCKETTWIYRVALNTACCWVRSATRRRAGHERVAAFAEADVGAGDPKEEVMARVQLEQLYAAIRSLPTAEASLIVMHLDGLSYREIGEVLGVTETNVGAKLSRARKQLAQILGGNEQ
jgi:RNA polymerase sigma-70 factor, ECF subfamily